MDIQPGSTVTVTVVCAIDRAGAQKTLGRLFLKDPAIRKQRRTVAKPVVGSRRAGRIWNHRPIGSDLVTPNVGASATLHATVDVIRDLNSVERFIQIK